jgi:hypothetical protein
VRIPAFFATIVANPKCGRLVAIKGDSVKLTTHCYSWSRIRMPRPRLLGTGLPLALLPRAPTSAMVQYLVERTVHKVGARPAAVGRGVRKLMEVNLDVARAQGRLKSRCEFGRVGRDRLRGAPCKSLLRTAPRQQRKNAARHDLSPLSEGGRAVRLPEPFDSLNRARRSALSGSARRRICCAIRSRRSPRRSGRRR